MAAARIRNRRIRTESECSARDEDTRTPLDPDSPEEGDDILSYCEVHDIPQPPDGGYGWVIVFASFMCNLIVDGIAYTFGVFMSEFVSYFDETKGKTAWVGSLLSGVYLLVGPVVSALANKYGCRSVCVAGSVIGCLAFVLSTFSPSIDVLMLTYGVMGGLGFGLIYLPAVVCVGYYFETKRSLATGIAVCGSGVGTFVFAPLATQLLEMFGWKGANLILAGLILNCAVFGALMRPLEFPSNSRCKPLLQRMAEEKRFHMERGSIGGSYFMVQLPDGTLERRPKLPLNIDPGVHSSFNLDQLVPGTPLTPVPTVPTLPTITEVKIPEGQTTSSESTSQTGSGNIKENSEEEKKVEEENKKNREVKENEENEDKDNDKEKDNKEKDEKDSLKNKQEKKDAETKREEEEDTDKPSSLIPPPGLPRNSSNPLFTVGPPGMPKNGSVPFFDRLPGFKKGGPYRPFIPPKGSRTNLNSGDLRKQSLQLRLSTSSFMGSRNNNCTCEDMWSKATDMDNETISFASKVSIPREKKDLVRPLSRKDIFYSGSIVNLPEYQSQRSLTAYRQSVLSLPTKSSAVVGAGRGEDDVEAPPPPDVCPCLNISNSYKNVLNSMLDVSLLKDLVFLFIGISNIFGMLGFYVPFVYIVDAAKLKGIDEEKAPFLLSIIGITNTVGRVASGWIADFPQVNSLLLNNLCILFSGVCIFVVPFCQSYTAFVAVCVFFGLCVSGYISLTSIILVDLLGLDKLTNAFGLLILFRGAASIVGSPLAGMVFDATESYDVSFFMAGGFLFFSAFLSFMVPIVKKYTAQPVIPPYNDALTPIDEEEDGECEEDEEEEHERANGGPEIVETAPSPATEEVKQIESVL